MLQTKYTPITVEATVRPTIIRENAPEHLDEQTTRLLQRIVQERLRVSEDNVEVSALAAMVSTDSTQYDYDLELLKSEIDSLKVLQERPGFTAVDVMNVTKRWDTWVTHKLGADGQCTAYSLEDGACKRNVNHLRQDLRNELERTHRNWCSRGAPGEYQLDLASTARAAVAERRCTTRIGFITAAAKTLFGRVRPSTKLLRRTREARGLQP